MVSSLRPEASQSVIDNWAFLVLVPFPGMLRCTQVPPDLQLFTVESGVCFLTTVVAMNGELLFSQLHESVFWKCVETLVA